MTPKQKTIFELIGKYASSRGCEYIEIDIDPWNLTPYNGRDFGCGVEKHEKTEKLPFDISEIITEYVTDSASDVDMDELAGMSFTLNPKTRTVIVSGSYQTLDDGPSEEVESHVEDNETLKRIMDELEEKGVYPYATVSFQGGGDEGYIEHELEVHSGSRPSIAVNEFGGLLDYLYDMLSNYGGWENDEGSYGEFTIDTRRGAITLKFTWNEYKYDTEVFSEETF